MNIQNSFFKNKNVLHSLRMFAVFIILFSSLKANAVFLISDWKVYFLFIIFWFLIETMISNSHKNNYLVLFFIIGLLKLIIVIFIQNFNLDIFYSAPDSTPLRDLSQTMFECFEYSRKCGGNPYFQRGPSYTIILTIFSLGNRLSALPLIIFQIFLFAYINAGIIEKINSKNKLVNSFIFITLAIFPSLATFSRIVLYEIWGVFSLFLAWKFSDLETSNKKYYAYFLFLISFSIYLQVQYFLVIFLFFLKFCYFNKYKFKHILIGFLVPILLILSWGFRNETHLGYWDFNPYSGCYLQKNIIEPTEILKGISYIDINSKTLSLIGINSATTELSEIELCGEFLKILPNYFIENYQTIFENYKNFSSKFFVDNLTCQYKYIGCESGYWFFLINKLFNYLLLVSILNNLINLNREKFY